MPEAQVVDPEVSRAKFAREVALHRADEARHRARGILLVDAVFPEAFALLFARRVTPAALLAGVVLDFTNYDLRPPSVRFVDPFTREPLKAAQLGISMPRRLPAPELPPEFVQLAGQAAQGPVLNMLQSYGPDEFPFLCLPGVREYHDHPAHTGDSWLLHRGSGEGSLHFVLDQIWKYGLDPFDQYQITDVRVTVGGLAAAYERIPA